MVIFGGQSDEGDGPNPVISDTWRFDLSTMVWTSFPSDPLAPAVSHSWVMPITNSTVVLYGGRTSANNLFGRTLVMHVALGWRPVLPAGARPERRTGHVVSFDPLKFTMLVSHGLNVKGYVYVCAISVMNGMRIHAYSYIHAYMNSYRYVCTCVCAYVCMIFHTQYAYRARHSFFYAHRIMFREHLTFLCLLTQIASVLEIHITHAHMRAYAAVGV